MLMEIPAYKANTIFDRVFPPTQTELSFQSPTTTPEN